VSSRRNNVFRDLLACGENVVGGDRTGKGRRGDKGVYSRAYSSNEGGGGSPSTPKSRDKAGEKMRGRKVGGTSLL